MDLTLFIGRLHPLIVHLPIGFLIMAMILEVLSRKGIINGQEKSIAYVLLFGTLSAIFSILFGWLLAESSAYDNQTLFLHRWLGITTAFLSAIAWWSKQNSKEKIYDFSIVGVGLFLVVTGYLGGTLTHGPDFLTQAFIVNRNVRASIPTQPDSITVYKHLIQPIFEAKCYHCHSHKKQDGGLDLSTWESTIKGGRNGSGIEQEIWDSEIFIRTTLPHNHKKFMPKKGEQLNFGEINLLKWWIANGASPNAQLMTYEIPNEIKNILLRDFNINPIKKPFIESIKINHPPLEKLILLRQLGWEINSLAQNNNLLEVSVSEGHSIENGRLSDLLKIMDHITWLNLGNKGIKDDDLIIISKFSNLSRLRIENNYISDEGVKHLVNLHHLESLNIYNNPITDKSLVDIERMQNLKKIFLWKTNTTPTGIDRIKMNRSDMVINVGNA